MNKLVNKEWEIRVIEDEVGVSRNYIAHLQRPRFSARIVMADTGNAISLCEVEWIDKPEVEQGSLMQAAADAFWDAYPGARR